MLEGERERKLNKNLAPLSWQSFSRQNEEAPIRKSKHADAAGSRFAWFGIYPCCKAKQGRPFLPKNRILEEAGVFKCSTIKT